MVDVKALLLGLVECDCVSTVRVYAQSEYRHDRLAVYRKIIRPGVPVAGSSSKADSK